MLSQVVSKPGSEPTPDPASDDPSNDPYKGSSVEKRGESGMMPDLNRLMEEHEQVVRESNRQNVSQFF